MRAFWCRRKCLWLKGHSTSKGFFRSSSFHMWPESLLSVPQPSQQLAVRCYCGVNWTSTGKKTVHAAVKATVLANINGCLLACWFDCEQNTVCPPPTAQASNGRPHPSKVLKKLQQKLANRSTFVRPFFGSITVSGQLISTVRPNTYCLVSHMAARLSGWVD